MTLATGTPLGNVDVTEDIYLEGSPSVYIQDYSAGELYRPDADGFYWGLSGTTALPVYEIGCPRDMSFTENLTSNDVLCDNVGVKDTIQQRNYVEFNFSFHSFFPFQILTLLLKGGPVTETAPTQKFGFGQINNNKFFHLYCPKIYDTSTNDYVWIHLHKCKIVDPWTLTMAFGTPWQGTGLKLRAFADTTKPAAQIFGSMGRLDPSVIV